VRVYIPTAAERDAWRETTQGAVREYIASQVGGPDLVTRVVAEAEAARRRVYGV
jgi:hypothetical protein